MAERGDLDQRLLELSQPGAYAAADLECDVVMKGGITSGVIYPPAVCELATTYRFRNIGGTSAGAIAAAVAAAAELGRGTETGGFGELAQLPRWLGKNLQKLFQPARGTRRLFHLLLAAGRHREGGWKKTRAFVATMIRLPLAGLLNGSFWLPLLLLGIGVIPFWALGWPSSESGLLHWTAFLLLGLAVLGGFWLGCLGAVILQAGRAIPAHHYGLVPGSEGGTTRGKDGPLTDWLHVTLNRLAGRSDDPSTPPLTFGDLWRGADGQGTPQRRAIHLEVLTTCLSLGRPFRLPDDFDPSSVGLRRFFFHRETFETFFPKAVVDHLVANAHRDGDARWQQVRDAMETHGLCPLPLPQDLPVVLAVRMSLSFPLLISAVPLHRIDENAPPVPAATDRKPEPGDVPYPGRGLEELETSTTTQFEIWSQQKEGFAARLRPEPCWFSDGGITSNFPVHIFDTLLPIRPTFTLNLRAVSPWHQLSERDERRNLDMPTDNNTGIVEWWHRWADPGQRGGVGGFLGAILKTMQNWNDVEQTRVPGYRDRVVHIYHSKDEGGLNLDMPAAVIHRLGLRGLGAGERMAHLYTEEAPKEEGVERRRTSWRNHRWVRLRSTLTLLERLLVDLHAQYETPGGGAPTFGEMLRTPLKEQPSYQTSGEQRDLARALLEGGTVKLRKRKEGAELSVQLPGLFATAEALQAALDFKAKASQGRETPQPEPELRISPGGGQRPANDGG
jgi:predicted acylesterase/phospholipase RssA